MTPYTNSNPVIRSAGLETGSGVQKGMDSGTASQVLDQGDRDRYFARGKLLDAQKVLSSFKQYYAEIPDVDLDPDKTIARKKRADNIAAIDIALETSQAKIDDMDTMAGPFGALKSWMNAAVGNAVLAAQPFIMLSQAGNMNEVEKVGLAWKRAGEIVAYHEPQGPLDKFMTLAAGNIFTTGIPLAATLLPGSLGITGKAAELVGTSLAVGAMAIPTTANSYLDLIQRGMPREDAILTAALHGIVETGIEFNLLKVFNKLGSLVGIESAAATKAQLVQKLYGALLKKEGSSSIGALVAAQTAKKLDNESARVLLKEFFGPGTRAGVLRDLAKTGSTAAFIGGAEEWLQEGSELFIKELALKNKGLDGIIPKNQDGSYDMNAVLSQMNDAFIGGMILEGMMGSVGGVMAARGKWQMADNIDNIKQYFGQYTIEVDKVGKPVGFAADPMKLRMMTPEQRVEYFDQRNAERKESGNSLIQLEDLGPDVMDYVARDVLAESYVASNRLEKKQGKPLTPIQAERILQKALKTVSARVLNNPLQSIMFQFVDAKFDVVSPTLARIKVGQFTFNLVQAKNELKGGASALYWNKPGKEAMVSVGPKLWNTIKGNRMNKDLIALNLNAGTTFPHEILHAIVKSLPKEQQMVFLDTIPAPAGTSKKEAYRIQQEGLADVMKTYQREKYWSPVKSTLGDLWATVDVAFNGRHAAPSSIQRVLNKKIFAALSGKEDLDFSKVSGLGFAEDAASAWKTTKNAAGKVADITGKGTGTVYKYAKQGADKATTVAKNVATATKVALQNSPQGEAGIPGGETKGSKAGSVGEQATLNEPQRQTSTVGTKVGGSKYQQAILTKPGESPDTFNGQKLRDIQTPDGSKVVGKFHTAQGSEYIITDSGMARRIKASHSNTQTDDSGLHEWTSAAKFLKDSDLKVNLAIQNLIQKGFNVNINYSKGQATVLVFDASLNKWRPASFKEAFPKAATTKEQMHKADKLLQTEYSDTPVKDYNLVEYDVKNNRLSKYHPGSEVSSIEQTASEPATQGEAGIPGGETKGKDNSVGLAQLKSYSLTPEFKQWFEGSKVFNPDGTPMVVYHGTSRDFRQFKATNPESGGFYFTPNPEYADNYTGVTLAKNWPYEGGKRGSNIKPVYLSLKNPKMVTEPGATYSISHETVRRLQEQGYDGLIATTNNDIGHADEIIAFDSSQIKSVFDGKIYSGIVTDTQTQGLADKKTITISPSLEAPYELTIEEALIRLDTLTSVDSTEHMEDGIQDSMIADDEINALKKALIEAGALQDRRIKDDFDYGEPLFDKKNFIIVEQPYNKSIPNVIDGHRGPGGKNVSNAAPNTPGWLGNPFVASDAGGKLTRQEAVEKFRTAFLIRINRDPVYRQAIQNLRGKVVGYYKPKEDFIHLKVIQDWLDQNPDTTQKVTPQTGTPAKSVSNKTPYYTDRTKRRRDNPIEVGKKSTNPPVPVPIEGVSGIPYTPKTPSEAKPRLISPRRPGQRRVGLDKGPRDLRTATYDKFKYEGVNVGEPTFREPTPKPQSLRTFPGQSIEERNRRGVLANLMRTYKEHKDVLAGLINQRVAEAPAEQQDSVRKELYKTLMAELQTSVGHPKGTEWDNKVRTTLFGMRDTATKIRSNKKAYGLLVKQAAFQRLDAAVKMAKDGVRMPLTDEQKAAIEKSVRDSIKNPKSSIPIAFLLTPKLLEDVKWSDWQFDAVMDTPVSDSTVRDILIDIVTKEAVGAHTQADISQKKRSEWMVQPIGNDTIQASEARHTKLEWIEGSPLVNVPSETVVQKKFSEFPSILYSWEHSNVDTTLSINVLFPLTRAGLNEFLNKTNSVLTEEQFNERYSFDEQKRLIAIRSEVEGFSLNLRTDRKLIEEMTDLLGPYWLAIREIRMANALYKSDYGTMPRVAGETVSRVEQFVRATLNDKTRGRNYVGSKLEEVFHVLTNTMSGGSQPTVIPGTQIPTTIQLDSETKRLLITAENLVQYLIEKHGLEDDGTSLTMSDIIGGENFAKNQESPEVDAAIKAIEADEVGGEDPDPFANDETVEQRGAERGIGSLDWTDAKRMSDVDIKRSAQGIARDIFRNLGELYADINSEGKNSSPRYAASVALTRTMPNNPTPQMTFWYHEVMTTLGNEVLAGVSRQRGENMNPPMPAVMGEGTLEQQVEQFTALWEAEAMNPRYKALTDLIATLMPDKAAAKTADARLGHALDVCKRLRVAYANGDAIAIGGSPELRSAMEAYLDLDPKMDTAIEYLKKANTFLDGLADKKVTEINALRGQLDAIKDVMHGVRDMRLLRHQLDMSDLTNQWREVFGLPPDDRLFTIIKGFWNSLLGNKLPEQDTTNIQARDLSRRWDRAAKIAIDMLNTIEMSKDDVDASTGEVVNHKITIPEVIASYRTAVEAALKNFSPDKTYDIARFKELLEDITMAEDILNRKDGYGAKVRSFIEDVYQPLSRKVWGLYRAQSIATHDATQVPYYTPWLLDDGAFKESDDIGMHEYNQISGRVISRKYPSLAAHFAEGTGLRNNSMLGSFDTGIAQIIHAVSNKEFIDVNLDSGYFSTKPLAGYVKLQAPGTQKVFFDIIQNGYPMAGREPFTKFSEALDYIKGKKGLSISIRREAVYAPKVEADYINSITKVSPLRESDVGRALMATNAKLKLVRVTWSMFHRRALLWGAMLAGPVGANMNFATSDLADWRALWNKLKHRFDYTERRKLGAKLAEERAHRLFSMTFYGMTHAKQQDFGDADIAYLTRLDRAILGEHASKAGNVSKKAIVAVSRATRILNNELFGRFGTLLKMAVGGLESDNAIKRNLAKILEEKAASKATNTFSPQYKAYKEVYRDRPEMMEKMESEYDGMGAYNSETENNILKSVAGMSNNDFGGIHLKRLGINPGTFDIMRLLLLGPDWTASNFLSLSKVIHREGVKGTGANSMWSASEEEAGMYRAFWLRAIGRSATIVFICNLLLSGLDFDDDFITRTRRAWKNGGLKAAMIDISPIIHLAGGDPGTSHYMNFAGVFLEPLRWAQNPLQQAYYKSSTTLKPILEAFVGIDYKKQRPTPIHEIPSKGLYTWNTKEKGPVKPLEMPSFLLRQMYSLLPIQVASLFDLASGEENVITKLMEFGTGVDIKRTYELSQNVYPKAAFTGGTPYKPR